jgi:hypothetical protein
LGDPTIAEQQAEIIHPHMLAVVMQTVARGHDIGRDEAGLYARPRTATAGLARELRDLRGKVRKAVAGRLDVEDWIAAWAALPARTRARLWQPRLIQTPEGRTVDRDTLAGSFLVPGYHTIAPRPEVVLTAITVELERIKTTPAARRRFRVRDEDERVAIREIRNAYRALTGKKGGRVIRDGRLVGRLIDLGHEIDGIFGTRLFAEKDSRRLR